MRFACGTVDGKNFAARCDEPDYHVDPDRLCAPSVERVKCEFFKLGGGDFFVCGIFGFRRGAGCCVGFHRARAISKAFVSQGVCLALGLGFWRCVGAGGAVGWVSDRLIHQPIALCCRGVRGRVRVLGLRDVLLLANG